MIRYKENALSPADYMAIRNSAHWHVMTPEQAKRALAGSLLTIAAKDGEKTVGMGRLVGDGAVIAYIQDVVVLPAYRKQEIGRGIILRLIEHGERLGVAGTTLTLGLMAARGKEAYYESFGFHARPNEREGAGMVMYRDL